MIVSALFVSVGFTCYFVLNTVFEILFEEYDYSIREGEALSTDIRLQFRNNENSFTVTLIPVSINTIEDLNMGVFIDYDGLSRATAGRYIPTHSHVMVESLKVPHYWPI